MNTKYFEKIPEKKKKPSITDIISCKKKYLFYKELKKKHYKEYKLYMKLEKEHFKKLIKIIPEK